jgi:Mg-chelatase subunit ChlD
VPYTLSRENRKSVGARRNALTLPFCLLLSLGLHLLVALALGVIAWTEPAEQDAATVLAVFVMPETRVSPRHKPLREPPSLAPVPLPDAKRPALRFEAGVGLPPVNMAAAPVRDPLPPMLVQPATPVLEPEAPTASGGLDALSVRLTTGANGGGQSDGLNSKGAPPPPAWRDRQRERLTVATALHGRALAHVVEDVPPPPTKSPLEIVADNVALRARTTDQVDVVFVLDASASMQDNIYAVSKHLAKMTDRLAGSGLDYRLAIVTFRHSTWSSILGRDLQVTALTSDLRKIRRTLGQVKCTGGERALDAIDEAIRAVHFRRGASRHFVFITDEYVDGTLPAQEVFAALYRERIQVDVIGMDEPFQRALAARTGGVWIPIANLPG